MIDVLLAQNAQQKQALCRYESMNNTSPTPDQPFYGAAGDTTESFHDNHSAANMAKQPFYSSLIASGEAKQLYRHTECANDGVNMLNQYSTHVYDGVKQSNQDSTCALNGVNTPNRYSTHANSGVNPFSEGLERAEDGVSKGQRYTLSQIDDVLTTGFPISAVMNGPVIESIYVHESRSALITYRNEDGSSYPANTAFSRDSSIPGGAAALPEQAGAGAAVKEKRLSIGHIESKLMSLTPNSNGSGIDNTCKILLQIQKSPRQSLKDLQKLTGLSEDGVVKRIMAMKKAGLLARVPGKRLLLLTSKAQKLLEDSMV